jgi:hypothetical protein
LRAVLHGFSAVLHGQAEMSAAFPLVEKYLSALSRNKNARARLNSVGGHGRFCFYVCSSASVRKYLATGDPPRAYEHPLLSRFLFSRLLLIV